MATAIDGPHLAVIEHATAQVPAEQQPIVEGFARAALRRVPSAVLAQADPDVAAAWLVDACRWMDERPSASPALRLFTPEVALDGRSDAGTVVEINSPDRPFLLTTITRTIESLGYSIIRTLHPIVGLERGPDGRIARIVPARSAPNRESFVHVEIDTALPDDEIARVRERLEVSLRDVIRATGDHDAMRDVVGALAERLRYEPPPTVSPDEAAETAALLEWLLDDNFVLLGWREYAVSHDRPDAPQVAVVPGSGLGILADEATSRLAAPQPVSSLPPEQQQRLLDDMLLRVSRTNRLATVHRPARMDYIGVKWFDADGRVVREHRLIGLITAAGYAEPSRSIPVLRRKLRTILKREDVVAGSHEETTIVSLFQALPKDELFQADVDQLHATVIGLLEAEEHQRVRVLARVEDFTRTVSILVAVPQDDYSPDLRKRLTNLLMARYAASRVDVDLSLSERDDAIVRFSVYVEGEVPRVPITDLERDVHALARSWADEARNALVEAVGEADGLRLMRTILQRLPRSYRDATSVEIARDDALRLDLQLRTGAPLAVWLQRIGGALHLKASRRDRPVELSEFIPILESVGLHVSGEIPYLLDGNGPTLALQDFEVRDDRGADLDPATLGTRLADAVTAAFHGRCEVDALNRLVLRAGLTWQQVAVLRAYRRYRRQAGTAYSSEYVNEALCTNPGAAAGLVALFDAKFDPDARQSPDAVLVLRAAVLAACDAIERLDHDRIVRGLLALIDATLRTNAFRDDSLGEDALGRPVPYLAFKLDSTLIPDLPRPVPHREIFVYSPAVEGIHLRGGPVARGGLRWSDRRDDMRTEVLGLMKAQTLKNAVIVPEGAKGGFVLKRAPAEATELRADVERQYRTFVRALLDVTDNVSHGEVIPPPRVRRYDGDDPYLVVAADKGTATFSDVANSIAEERGFWLGDAFASGGSHGYDHKALGITARGAWVAVSRHFRELGIDIQTEPVSVAGVGDMSGDVFGNGMVLSRAIRLVAAFDHRDIFIDPDPDPATSFAERERLFHLPRSSWQDYDAGLISPGGGIFSRASKKIPLSEQARTLLRIDETEPSPAEVIRAILRAPVDLLYFGGIGTYVKASTETNAEIGDRANDELRVDAGDLRARVVGEGANLAVTQRGRIQYARRGGRIDQDAVHNAAGVDISDHEVNVKILLGLAEEAGALDRADRDVLLDKISDDIVAHVLRDVRLQTWQLSQEAARSATSIERYRNVIGTLERAAVVDRDVEVLPSEAELDERAEAGAGLTRPELATLVASAKRLLTADLLASSLPDDRAVRPIVASYFPPLLIERFGELVERHRLRRELVATLVANDVVNRLGPTFAFVLADETSRSRVDVLAAYWAARQVSDADRWWQGVEHVVGTIDPDKQLTMKARVDGLVEDLTRNYLDDPDRAEIERIVRRDHPAYESVRAVLHEIGTPGQRRTHLDRTHHLLDDLVTPDVADVIAGAEVLTLTPDLGAMMRRLGPDARALADAALHAGDALGIDLLQGALRSVRSATMWEVRQANGIEADLRRLQRRAVEAAAPTDAAAAPAAVRSWLERNADRIAHARSVTEDATTGTMSLTAISVAARAVADLFLGV